MDKTDYVLLDNATSNPCGLVIAIPHHGHYILSIVGIVEHLRRKRDVFVFYGAPATHSGNEIFDALYARLYGHHKTAAHIIHDTRSGMSEAIRALRSGAAVIIMPDAYRHVRDTYSLPFCNRPLNVMLGTAAIARRTNSVILPAISNPEEGKLSFSTAFGPIVSPGADQGEDMLHRDYCTMARLFQHFEQAMSDRIIYWQHARSHYMRMSEFPSISSESLEAISDLFFRDPRIQVDTRDPVRLD
jgi:lauroyl/myristoyl acyltransferase